MKKLVSIIGMALMLAVTFTGCKTPNLEPGGAYNPQPGIIAPEKSLFVADAGYQLAYTAIDEVFKYERNNRAQLAAISPAIKPALDKLRDEAWDINVRWAKARQAYKLNPTPANLTTFQNVLSEIQRLVPVVQTQLTQSIQ